MRWFLIVVMVAGLLAACGEDSDDVLSAADSTATREAALGEIATIQAEDATPTVPIEPTGTATRTAVETSTIEPVSTSTPSPTVPPEPTATNTVEPTATEEPSPTPEQDRDYLSLLPTVEDLPVGFALVEEGALTAPEIAAAYDDPNAHLDLLESWGFKGGARRNFEIPSPGLDGAFAKTILITASVVEHGSPEQAREAAEHNRDTIQSGEGAELPSVGVGQIGDNAFGIQGTISEGEDSAIFAFIWVQVGNLSYSFRGASLGHNPLEDIITIANATLD